MEIFGTSNNRSNTQIYITFHVTTCLRTSFSLLIMLLKAIARFRRNVRRNRHKSSTIQKVSSYSHSIFHNKNQQHSTFLVNVGRRRTFIFIWVSKNARWVIIFWPCDSKWPIVDRWPLRIELDRREYSVFRCESGEWRQWTVQHNGPYHRLRYSAVDATSHSTPIASPVLCCHSAAESSADHEYLRSYCWALELLVNPKVIAERLLNDWFLRHGSVGLKLPKTSISTVCFTSVDLANVKAASMSPVYIRKPESGTLVCAGGSFAMPADGAAGIGKPVEFRFAMSILFTCKLRK